MKIEILYKSKRNTRKLAEAIGNAFNVKPKNIDSSLGRAMVFVARSHPDADDLNGAVKFAESICR